MTSLSLFLIHLMIYKGFVVFGLSCAPGGYFCVEVLLSALYWGFFPKSIIGTAILLMFFPERAFKWWRWFAIVSAPLMVHDIATTKITGDFMINSPQLASGHWGTLFLSLSMTIALMSVLLGKVKQHTFTSNNSRVGAYVGSVLVSIAFGASIAAVLLMRYL